ncbi:MAG TPA: hypothetical protein VJC39_05685 [Candidatus Nanoarchaeia archaeon]|nr:hypothetical protein [Candidatus Nanoarchaeia archaeon]
MLNLSKLALAAAVVGLSSQAIRANSEWVDTYFNRSPTTLDREIAPVSYTPCNMNVRDMAVADLDKDGDPDYILIEQRFGKLYLCESLSGLYSAMPFPDAEGTTHPRGSAQYELDTSHNSYVRVQVVDINEDFWPDVLAVSQSGKVVLFNNRELKQLKK